MAFNTPGIYIEETSPSLAGGIVTAGTSNTVFFGFTTKGPVNAPIALSSIDDFYAVFGNGHLGETAPYAVRGFFANGGNKAYFVRMASYDTMSGDDLGVTASQSISFDTAGSIQFFSGYKGIKSPGLSGNTLSVSVTLDSKHTSVLSSAVAAGDTSVIVSGITGIQPGSLLKIDDGTNVDIVEVSRVATAIVSGSIRHTVHLVSSVTNAYLTNTPVVSLEYTIGVLKDTVLVETWPQLSPNPLAANSLDLTINDPQLGSAYITTLTDLSTGKGDASTALTNDATWATGKLLSGGTSEYDSFSSDMFGNGESFNKGIHAIDQLRDAQLLCAPPNATESWGIQANASYHAIMLDYCKSRMNLFAILDAPADQTTDEMVVYRNTILGADSIWGAMFYPYLKVQDPSRPLVSATITVPPSGFVAGVMSRVDGIAPPTGGVSAAAAGVSEFGRIDGIVGVSRVVSDKEQEKLNPIGVNCIRLLDRATGGKGVFIYGARTLSSDINFKYIPLRRTLTFVEETIRLSSQFAVFQKNGPDLWNRLSQMINSFLFTFWSEGNLAGSKISDAYFVKIDSSTTSAQDVANGILRGKIGVSLHRPAEFIVFTFTQTTNGSSVQE